MISETWLTGTDFDGMLYLAMGLCARKARHFAAAYCCQAHGTTYNRQLLGKSPDVIHTLRLGADGLADPALVAETLDKVRRTILECYVQAGNERRESLPYHSGHCHAEFPPEP